MVNNTFNDDIALGYDIIIVKLYSDIYYLCDNLVFHSVGELLSYINKDVSDSINKVLQS